MRKKWIIFLSGIILVATNATAQKELSIAEVQGFFKLIKQTTEYKRLQATIDSFNIIVGNNGVPQEINIEMLKKEQYAAPDDYIFGAWVERRLAVGFGLEKYRYSYDKRKKQIISVELVYRRNMN